MDQAGYRIQNHPILPVEPRRTIPFHWQGLDMIAQEGETIASALFAYGVRTFGHHPKDGAPQGLFCANGQCAQCLVLADGQPVKACMTLVRPGMRVEPMDGLPALPPVHSTPDAMAEIERIAVPILIVGGGPAGLSAAIELGRLGVETLLVDDKHRLGGKLVLQTHRFFGSVETVYAGTRGIDIAAKLETQVRALDSVYVWLDSTALAVFADRQVGILRSSGGGSVAAYVLVEPQALLVATGARERSLAFKGNTLPGVYGAGAFQTLVNRDLVRAAGRLFIVGGGNVGLIAGYHALQAGIEVVGLVEALPECGGYKVHRDKLARIGVPIYTSHTILSANGTDRVDSVTIAQVDEQFHPVSGTERSFTCDTVLIAVGLNPVDEFVHKARQFGLAVYSAGDAEEIAEASAAMLTGKIRGVEIARALGCPVEPPPIAWYETAEMLKSRPGATAAECRPENKSGVVPVFHCAQEIPCDPCTALCPRKAIRIDGDIRQLPHFVGDEHTCIGCERCVIGCPGLAITLVDYRQDAERPTVSIPYELGAAVAAGDWVTMVDTEGQPLGRAPVVGVRAPRRVDDRTWVIRVQTPAAWACRAAGIRVQPEA
ncbi:MAG: FAD-dependent oxidoreductase, partial [Anaerolineae bacterium]|nr:FAD-dependent oxidoreductase [Anaerolineae bacterium]